ncbi:tRNA epoxyqueuosine(34) reductase QueG [Granulicella sp. WH15]|nr:tRNA epoxyqueuosine(34) reductase QueG [Granulicella sp. WH15]
MIEFTRGEAVSAGFDLAGVAEAFASEQDAGRLTAERFTAWIDEGRAGEMEYLKRRDEHGELLRRSVRVALPWARSVVVCAFNYNAAGPRSLDPAAAGDGWIARYAWNGTESGEPTDYHDDLLARLRAVETALHDVAECETRCYVDTGPLLERDLAAKAGVGWVGKNTCVLNQKIGSWMLLGVIVTSLPLGPGLSVEEAADRCGSCTRCIDACPTDALVAPRQMDASLCIAYLTIEKKGSIAEELREPMGRQVFGCDICQEVCPWNRRAPVSVRTGLATRDELINPALEWLGAMEQDEFRRRFRGSPLERTKLKRLRRNVAIAMGNSGEQGFRPRLAEWAAAEDEVLAEAASWALGRLAVKETED